MKKMSRKERMFLVKRVIKDNQIPAQVAEDEIGKVRSWAYKWLERFQKKE
jgi:leucine-zipper of insertion element IS481